jgi:hypothetical protein
LQVVPDLGFVVVTDCYCEFFRFPKLSFGLKPELGISSNRPTVFFPDFAGAIPDFVFVRLCKSKGSLFQLSGQS